MTLDEKKERTWLRKTNVDALVIPSIDNGSKRISTEMVNHVIHG